MCGIVGYTGARDALDIVLSSLARVTYRGYDSFGVAILDGAGVTEYKAVGSVDNQNEAIPRFRGTVGIGHTRWATVGKVSQQNAHPHFDCGKRVAVVHNGDIDNYLSLKKELEERGHVFRSETDSEVIAHLIEEGADEDLLDAVEKAVGRLEGSYAITVLRDGAKDLAVARKGTPLVIGLGDGEMFVASDIPAMVPYTRRVLYLEDGDVARLSGDHLEVRNGGISVARAVHQAEWSRDQLDRGGFEHFMLKEMHEQPNALRDTLESHGRVALSLPAFCKISHLLLMGCGTSYHACLVAKEILGRRLPFPVDVVVASEYRPNGLTPDNALAVALSQSGETADTLMALQAAKKAGYHTVAVTNVGNSSITRIADDVLYTKAGPEMAVAATKTFLSQLAALYALGAALQKLTPTDHETYLGKLSSLAGHVRRVLEDTGAVERIGRKLGIFDNLFIIGRGVEMPVALEGALKFKEVAYVHAEGCYAGELKHGPFALLGPDVPVIALVGQDEHRARMLTSMREIRARGALVVALAAAGDQAVYAVADEVIQMPALDSDLLPFVHTVVLQLLAYYCAQERGCPIDRPRNLAKSVTVL